MNNFTLREAFFVKIFTLADFRAVEKSGEFSQLMKFQARHKLLFMAANQTEMRRMGKLAANLEKLPFETVVKQYRQHLLQAFKNGLRPSNAVNVLMHALGYFKKELITGEKTFFLDLLERFRQRKAPLSAPVSVMKSWVVKYNVEYLAQQSFFEPYPEQLVTITDSGKGRDYL